jgi:hypothetical protein
MATKQITIEKVGGEPPKLKKSVKTFPRGIMKKKFTLKGVKDPAKSTPLKKGMKTHTLRLLTDKGMRKHRKTMKKRISSLSDSKVTDLVQKAGIVTNPKTPNHISRQILDNAVSAGFVSI